MKFTLLSMTQDILSSLSSDEVNSIGDTTESLQIANIIKQKFFDIINRVDLPNLEQLIQLDSSLDAASPVVMTVPDSTGDIKWIKYFDSSTSGLNTSNGFTDVQILPNLEFINKVTHFNPDEDDVDSFEFSENSSKTYKLYYFTDRTPRCCTIIKNYWVIFDSYDNTLENTLQSSKTMCLGRTIPVFRMEDSFVPDLAEDQFQLLFNESKALAFYELKQQPHQLALVETKRGWSNVQKTKAISNTPSYFDALPNFGRGGRGSNSSPRLFKQLGFDK